MFSLPNKRGFEVVMQFLFERLNPALSRERFRWDTRKKQKKLGMKYNFYGIITLCVLQQRAISYVQFTYLLTNHVQF